MRVKVDIKLGGRAVILMHKNAPSAFSRCIYLFMKQHGCSRTEEELMSISTDELLKDMWYLGISPDTVTFITAIDDELLHGMLYNIEHCGGDEVELGNLFHAYTKMLMDSGEWGNV